MRIAHPPHCLISPLNQRFLAFPSQKRFLSFHSLNQRRAQNLALTPRPERSLSHFSMAGAENVSTAISAEEDEKFGFSRPEMYQSILVGTITEYDRHVFLCSQSPEAWLPRVEQSETDPLPKLLSSAVKARKDEITTKTLVTITEGRDGTEYESGDVLIFPDLIRYKGLKDSDVDGFVDDVLVNGKPWASAVQEVLTGSYIFVCAHGSRDKRCGVCGPILIEKLKEGIETRGLKDQISVHPCSHVGGHKYAGNVIIYSPDSVGKYTGHWYGYVTPDDVPEILDQHIAKGVVMKRLWRGQMGLSVQEMKERHASMEHEESNTEVNKENAGGCCQGVNGFSCCRDGEANEVIKMKENKGLSKLPCWISSLEQSNVLAGVAVVGAVATIAVAYSLYKRSG